MILIDTSEQKHIKFHILHWHSCIKELTLKISGYAICYLVLKWHMQSPPFEVNVNTVWML